MQHGAARAKGQSGADQNTPSHPHRPGWYGGEDILLRLDQAEPRPARGANGAPGLFPSRAGAHQGREGRHVKRGVASFHPKHMGL